MLNSTPGWIHCAVGGTEIGADRGYGPARYLTPEEVREVADALSKITAEQLLERFDPGTMDRLEVYPGDWEGEPENREWLADAFSEVSAFYSGVAARGNAVLLYLS